MRCVSFRLLACLAVSMTAHVLIIELDGVKLMQSTAWGGSAAKRLEASLRPAVNKPAESIPAKETDKYPIPASADHPEFEPVKPMDPIAKPGIARMGIDAYLAPRFLTRRPYPLSSIDPSPPHFKLDGLIGSAKIVLLISSEGKVDRALVIDSNLPEIIVDSAIKSFEAALFSPGYVNEKAVRSQFFVELGTDTLAVNVGEPGSAKQIRERQLKSRQLE